MTVQRLIDCSCSRDAARRLPIESAGLIIHLALC